MRHTTTFLQTPILSLQTVCQNLIEHIEKSEKDMRDKISNIMNIPPQDMMNSLSTFNPIFKMQFGHAHKTSTQAESATLSDRQRRTSFSNESRMRLYNLEGMPLPPKTTTNRALAVKDYLPLLKNDKRGSILSNDSFNSSENEIKEIQRKGSLAMFSPKLQSKASRFKEMFYSNMSKKIEWERCFEIYKFFQHIFN